jgi:hypothetical protein
MITEASAVEVVGAWVIAAPAAEEDDDDDGDA